jgi:DNA-binding MarR family transcriptional regulator
MTRALQEIALSVKQLHSQHQRALNGRLAPLDVSLVQWEALRHLDLNPGASLHDLAELTAQTDQSFGALAARLIDRGLIERIPGPGRAVRHRLTDKGADVCRAGDAIVNQLFAECFAPLSSYQLELFDTLLLSLLHPGQRPGAGS